MQILKYEVPLVDNFILQLPESSKILSFQVQNDIPVIWVLQNKKLRIMNYHFSIYGTGHELSSTFHIGTIQHHSFVWHLFLDECEEIEYGD